MEKVHTYQCHMNTFPTCLVGSRAETFTRETGRI